MGLIYEDIFVVVRINPRVIQTVLNNINNC